MTTLSPGTQHGRVTVKLSVLGEIQLDRALQGRIKATSDLRPAFEKIGEDYEDMERSAFSHEGAYEGNPAWQPLSAVYAKWKAKHFPGKGILVRSGDLMASLTGGAGSIREIEPLRMTIGGSVRVGRWDLGALHQTGTRRGMPKRKPLNLSMARRHRWMRYILAMFRGENP
jgi:phage gpG-like protein